jgi:hypothetical protein
MKHKVKVQQYRIVRRTLTRVVTLPDDPTPQEISAGLNTAGWKPSKGWKLDACHYVDPPKQSTRVPDECWSEMLDGHRWATDGSIMIRDDCPLPDLPHKWWMGWKIPKTLAELRGQLERVPACHEVSARFNIAFAPVFKAGKVCLDTSGVALVYRDGEIIAVVQKMRNGDLVVDYTPEAR